MKIRNFFKPLIVCGIVSMAFIGCSKDKDDDTPGGGGGGAIDYSSSIMGSIDKAEGLDSFAVALKYTGLDQTLASTNNLTVFAPDNDAFIFFLDRRGANHVKALSKEILIEAINYHIGTSVLKSANFSSTKYITSMSKSGPEGAALSIQVATKSSGTFINGVVPITKSDINGSNGVVHVVASFAGKPTVRDFIQNDTRLTKLNVPFSNRNAEYDLDFGKTDGSLFTFFAPNNEGFDNYIANNPLFNSVENIDEMHIASVLNIHVLGGTSNPLALRTEDMTNNQNLTTWQGANGTISISISGANISIKTPNPSQPLVKIVDKDLQAVNGVVHVIEDVLTFQ